MNNNYISFQGIAGAHSEEALLIYAAKHRIPVTPEAQEGYFRELFAGIKKNKLGWVPIENSYHGTVVESVDLMREYKFEILDSYTHVINHCLAVNPGVKKEDITKAYSHPQALGQCAKYLEKNGITALPYVDTAAAARYVSEKKMKHSAAICSKRAAELYGLEIIEDWIQDSGENETTFLLVKTRDHKIDFQDELERGRRDVTTTVVFETTDVPAALYKCLGAFATNAINLKKIESRPARNHESDWFFYLDFEGHPDDPLVQNALSELDTFAKTMSILGSY